MSKLARDILEARRMLTVTAEILKPRGLTILAWLVLDLMCDTGDPERVQDYRQADIARELDMPNNEARRTLVRLEEDGLVERISVAHVFRFGPSPKGEKLYRDTLKEMT